MAARAGGAPWTGQKTSEALTTPVTTSVPTRTTTSVLFSSSTPLAAVDAGVAVGIYTRAGVTWSTATTTAVFGSFPCKPVAGGRRENSEEPSPSPQIRSEQTYTRATADLYDNRVADGWDPHPKLVSCAYPYASVHHATQPLGTSFDV